MMDKEISGGGYELHFPPLEHQKKTLLVLRYNDRLLHCCQILLLRHFQNVVLKMTKLFHWKR